MPEGFWDAIHVARLEWATSASSSRVATASPTDAGAGAEGRHRSHRRGLRRARPSRGGTVGGAQGCSLARRTPPSARGSRDRAGGCCGRSLAASAERPATCTSPPGRVDGGGGVGSHLRGQPVCDGQRHSFRGVVRAAGPDPDGRDAQGDGGGDEGAEGGGWSPLMPARGLPVANTAKRHGRRPPRKHRGRWRRRL